MEDRIRDRRGSPGDADLSIPKTISMSGTSACAGTWYSVSVMPDAHDDAAFELGARSVRMSDDQ
jgi:hypothetical protein